MPMQSSFQKIFGALLLCLVVMQTAFAQDYTLGAGDVIEVKVYQFPDLGLQARVSQDGTISYPLIGEVKVAGLTERQVEQVLAERLRDSQVVRRPQVLVMVREYLSRRVSVLGQVNQPGEFVLQPNRNVIDLLSKAGGMTPEAADFVVVTTPGDQPSRRVVKVSSILEGDVKGDVALSPGDVIFVPTAPKVYVHGSVNRAGAYRYSENMSVVQAISLAGGISVRGSKNGLKVMRQTDEGVGQELSVGLADQLQAEDVLYVRESLF